MREREIGSRQELEQEGHPLSCWNRRFRVQQLRKHSAFGGVLLMLVCSLAGTRARAQGDDLVTAAGDGDLVRVKALLDAKADVNARTGDGRTTLLFAAQNGR